MLNASAIVAAIKKATTNNAFFHLSYTIIDARRPLLESPTRNSHTKILSMNKRFVFLTHGENSSTCVHYVVVIICDLGTHWISFKKGDINSNH